MSGGAASGESFAADADNAAWLDPRTFPARNGMTGKSYFPTMWLQSHSIRIEALCEYRAFSEKRRGK